MRAAGAFSRNFRPGTMFKKGTGASVHKEKMMSRIRFLGASLIALSAAAGPAAAADITQDTYTPPPDVTYDPAPAFSWTGFYAGGLVGYGWGNVDTDTAGDFDADGFLGGVFTGYNYQFPNNVVLGIEGDVTYHDQDGSSGGVSAETDWNGTLRPRLGYAFDRFMPYVTGGLAVGNVEASEPGDSDSGAAVGWTAGAGIETAITDNIIGRVEYRYTDLGSNGPSLAGAGDVDVSSHGVMVGLGFKF
jgi:outer membrane immunogenic protein